MLQERFMSMSGIDKRQGLICGLTAVVLPQVCHRAAERFKEAVTSCQGQAV